MIPHGKSERANHSPKADLRRSIKATIAGLDPAERRAQEAALVVRFSGLPGLADAGTVLLFVAALPEEPRAHDLLSLAFAMKKVVLCPRVDRRGRKLSLHRVADPASDLIPGALGIPEPRRELPEIVPSAVDWALVPGLAFDERGFRLGRGAGYYDRLLPLLRPDATCWALCLNCQLVRELPVEPHDAPLSGIFTPEREVRGIRRR